MTNFIFITFYDGNSKLISRIPAVITVKTIVSNTRWTIVFKEQCDVPIIAFVTLFLYRNAVKYSRSVLKLSNKLKKNNF